VDDIILATSFDSLRQSIMAKLGSDFVMKDLGPLSYFLGISVTRDTRGLFYHKRNMPRKFLSVQACRLANLMLHWWTHKQNYVALLEIHILLKHCST